MKRRDIFKMLATFAAMPLVAPLAALYKPKRAFDQTFYIEYEANAWRENAKEHVLETIRSMPVPTAFNPTTAAISYSEYADAGRMPTYEGVVYGVDGTRLWRFDVVSESNFKCRNCDLILPFSREDFRQHGQSCNHKLEEYKS